MVPQGDNDFIYLIQICSITHISLPYRENVLSYLETGLMQNATDQAFPNVVRLTAQYRLYAGIVHTIMLQYHATVFHHCLIVVHMPR